jgi:hypothetical protein
MREDMSKVIVERPRHGGGVRFPRYRERGQSDFDRLPRCEGIQRPWARTSCQKDLNENLAPLKRYLRSNVGRPWRKVFGDIRERINMDSAVQFHIWQHVQQYVCLEAIKLDGMWFDQRGMPARSDFVVDARNGLLRENSNETLWKQWKNKSRERRREQEIERSEMERGYGYREIDGIWYEVKFSRIPTHGQTFYDVVRRELILSGSAQARRDFAPGYYASNKRQLNSKEIRQLGLNQ